jgi:hypothetical protein
MFYWAVFNFFKHSKVLDLWILILNSLCSIGSLGKDGAYETVEEVHVKSCAFKGTQNGVRIKTWEVTMERTKTFMSFHVITLKSFHVKP